jgi:hypothetical protein
MSYLGQSEIAASATMQSRVAQCATEQDIPEADGWTYANRREWAAAPGWADAWASAQASHPDDPDFDAGADEAVITDQMILSQVQSMVAAESPGRDS